MGGLASSRHRPAGDRAARAGARADAAARRAAVHRRRARVRRLARAARPASGRAVLRQGGGGQGARARVVELPRRRGGRRRRTARIRLSRRGARRARPSSGVQVEVSLTHTRREAAAVAIAGLSAHALGSRSWRAFPTGSSRCPTPPSSARSTSGRSASAGSPGLELMERAGTGLADLVGELVADGPDRGRLRQGQQRRRRVRRGAAAARAGPRGRRAAARSAAEELRGDARANCERLPGAARGRSTPAALDGAAAIVDAILGTGFAGEPREPAAGAIEAINAAARGGGGAWSPATSRAASTPRRGEVAGAAVRGARDGHLPRRQAGAVDRPGQGARGRGPGDRHRDPGRRSRRAARSG